MLWGSVRGGGVEDQIEGFIMLNLFSLKVTKAICLEIVKESLLKGLRLSGNSLWIIFTFSWWWGKMWSVDKLQLNLFNFSVQAGDHDLSSEFQAEKKEERKKQKKLSICEKSSSHLRQPTVCGVCVEVGISKRIKLQNVSQLFLITTCEEHMYESWQLHTCNRSQRQYLASLRISKLAPQSFRGCLRRTDILQSCGLETPSASSW